MGLKQFTAQIGAKFGQTINISRITNTLATRVSSLGDVRGQ
jgi:hypothetical protein